MVISGAAEGCCSGRTCCIRWFGGLPIKRADKCIACGGNNLRRHPGGIAPFITQYALEKPEPDVWFCFCIDCQMIFCDPRFEAAEMERLYSGYRGERYTRERDALEPGYAERNEKIARDPGELMARQAFCSGIVARGGRKVSSVLDYGGDRGQFIPASLKGAARYVYEVSGVQPELGIISVTDPHEAGPYDLVMCCHVLEHVPQPANMLTDMASHVALGGAIYIEVPAGIPAIRYFEASLFRNAFARRRQVFHEHVNAFTECSLRNMMSCVGIRTISIKTRFLDYGWCLAPVIGCLGIPGASPTPPRYRRADMFAEGVRYAARKLMSRHNH